MFEKFNRWRSKTKLEDLSMFKAYSIALKEIGVRETAGLRSTARVLEYHMVTKLRATSDSVPWCSSFVCWCLEQAGIISTRSAAARSYLNFGKAVIIPYTGCIVVMKRGTNPQSGHVGFFIREYEGLILILGGNQRDSVSIQGFPKGDLLAYREI